MNNNVQEEILFKQKRDEYLVEIRKKKNNDFITAKRTKLTQDAMNNGNLNPDYTNIPPVPELGSLFVQNFKAGNLQGLLTVLTQIRVVVSRDDNPPLNELIQTHTVPLIISLLDANKINDENIIAEALWILINLASKEDMYVNYIVGNDVIPKCIKLIEHPSFSVQENALWILSNISGESIVYRNDMLKLGIVDVLDKLLIKFEGPEDTIVCVSWLISNLCRGEPYPRFNEISTLLPYIEHIIKNHDNIDSLGHCMWTILYITNNEDNNIKIIEEVIGMKILNQIIALLSCSTPKVIPPIIRTLGNIINGTDLHAQAVIDAGAIQALYPLLNHPIKLIRKEACWAYSNLLAGVPSQVKDVFDYDGGKVIDALFDRLMNDEIEVQDEVIYALTNACETGGTDEIAALVDRGILETLIDILKLPPKADVIKICLQAINEVIDEGRMINGLASQEYNPYSMKLIAYKGHDVIENIAYCHQAAQEFFGIAEIILKKLNRNILI